MLESMKPRGGKRWPRGQKFRLSEKGALAEAAYCSAIQAARALPGRASLEAAESAWGAPLGVQPGDGVVLSELRSGRRSLSEVAAALEDCGRTVAEVKSALDRLVEREMVEPVPSAAPAMGMR